MDVHQRRRHWGRAIPKDIRRGSPEHAHRGATMSSDIEDTINNVRAAHNHMVADRCTPEKFTDVARALRDWLDDMIPHCRDCCIDYTCDGCLASERAEQDMQMERDRRAS